MCDSGRRVRTISFFYHIPTLTDISFDIDLPIECDDEYWEAATPEQCFKQPPGKPSRITAFNLLLKLNRILSFSLRTIVRHRLVRILLPMLIQYTSRSIP